MDENKAGSLLIFGKNEKKNSSLNYLKGRNSRDHNKLFRKTCVTTHMHFIFFIYNLLNYTFDSLRLEMVCFNFVPLDLVVLV